LSVDAPATPLQQPQPQPFVVLVPATPLLLHLHLQHLQGQHEFDVEVPATALLDAQLQPQQQFLFEEFTQAILLCLLIDVF